MPTDHERITELSANLALIAGALGAPEDTLWSRLPDVASELRARVAELEGWQELQVARARRAVDDPDRLRRIYDPQQPDLAVTIDAALDERDALRARIAELEAERPRFSQRQFMQALRDRDEAQSRAAELAERFAELEAAQRPPLAPVERCSDCGYPSGRQADCDTCHGVPVVVEGDSDAR